MRHTWSSAELDLVSSKRQRAKWYLAIHRPQTLAHYTIDNSPVNHPVSAIAVTEVSGESFVDEGHTAWIGTGAGMSDLGRVRIRRKPAEWTGSNMPIMEAGSGLIRWDLATNVTVVDEYRPWVKHPRYNTATSKWNWDYDYSDAGQLKTFGPMVVMGAPFVGILVDGSISGSFVAGNTLAIDSPLIAGSFWTTPDGRNFFHDGTETSPKVIDFSGASPHGNYIKYTAIDGNSASHIGKRLIFAFDNVDNLPRVVFTSIQGGKPQGGYTTQIYTYGLDDDDLAPGTEIIIFEAASYGNTACAMGGNSPFRNNIVFRGWTTNEQIIKNPNTGMTIITAETINGVMANQPSYDTFYVETNPVPTASEIIGTYNLSLDRVTLNHMRWRSTVGDICDFYPASGFAMSLHPIYQNLPRASWWDQLRSNYYERGLLWGISSDLQSNIFSYEDINITGGSGNYTAFPDLTAKHFGGQVNIERVYHDQAAQVKLYAVASVTPFGGESPGNVLGYAGGDVAHEQGLITDTQDRIITWSGNMRAKLNAEFKRVVVPLAGNIRLDPVPNAVVPITMADNRNARKLNWSSKLFIPQELTINYNVGRGVTTELVFEEIVNGKGGSAITFPTITAMPPPDPDDNPPPPGPSVGSDVVYVMGTAYLGRTRDFGANNPIWGTVSSPTATRYYDFILDPWNPVNRAWLSTSNGLYKTSNLNDPSPTWELSLSKATIESTVGKSEYVDGYKVIGSINKQNYFAFFFICGNATDNFNLYCARTSDNGTTWAIVSVADNHPAFAWGGAADYVPHLVNGQVVLYAAAIGFTGSPPTNQLDIYKSTNSGATWSFLQTVVSGGFTYVFSVHCPYDENQNGLIAYVTSDGATYRTINGTTFADLGINPEENISRTAVETYTQDKDLVYIWDNNDIIQVSTNNAVSFSARGTVPGTIKAAGGFPFDQQRYYAVSDTGIYASFDGGNNFVNKTNNYPVSQLSPSGSFNKAVIVPVWVS